MIIFLRMILTYLCNYLLQGGQLVAGQEEQKGVELVEQKHIKKSNLVSFFITY